MSTPVLSPEIWYLIFQTLPTRNDLKNAGQVCKSFDALSTPVLYRSAILRQSPSAGGKWHQFPSDANNPERAEELSFGLFHRLLDDRNKKLRAFVRDLTLEGVPIKIDHPSGSQNLENLQNRLQDRLTDLVTKLPNLENIYFEAEFHLPQSFVDALQDHKKSPKLHLLKENGRTQGTIQRPCVRVLRTILDATSMGTGFDQKRLALGELFNAYPNLESLSVFVNRFRGGCVIGGMPTAQIVPLMLSENGTFPPLHDLALSGYHIVNEECSLWKERLSWEKLRTLSLGPQNNKNFLTQVTGYIQGLTDFSITSYGQKTFTPPPELDSFLSSFHSLERLTAKGSVPSLDAVAHHPKLKHLCLHAIEKPDQQRPMLDVKEIQSLDQRLPSLTSLEIDVNPDSTCPVSFINPTATGFSNLRQLSMHVGLGVARGTDDPAELYNFEPMTFDAPLQSIFSLVLTESTAQDFAKRFFDLRGSSVLKTITLKTGENLRWFPQWPPRYADAEEECARILEIHSPRKMGDAPLIKRPETYRDRLVRKRRFQSWDSGRQPPLSRGPRIL